MSKIFIGIDPGAGGGVAVLWETGGVSAYACPDTFQEMADILFEFRNANLDRAELLATAIIEQVHSMPGQGVSSTFAFGKNYGAWLGILSAYGIPYQEVTPQKWQKHFGTMPKEKKDRKNRLKELAQQRFPASKATLKTADAILLALYLKETSK